MGHTCICSTPTWNSCKLRIAQCKLGIPSLAGKLRIKQAVQSLCSILTKLGIPKFALLNSKFVQIPS